jgi:ABC-type multidrug transport system permease subunit
MVPASILILALVIFTGFVIPVDYMLDWCRWINYLDPVAYGFEAVRQSSPSPPCFMLTTSSS